MAARSFKSNNLGFSYGLKMHELGFGLSQVQNSALVMLKRSKEIRGSKMKKMDEKFKVRDTNIAMLIE